ncbi:hypothetical protein AHAS_Ahas02G0077700 [Arachis hypogaea]
MVPNSNYVPPSMATKPSPITQQPAAMAMPPPAMEATTPESSHRSEAADAPPPPPVVQLTIWPDGGTGFYCLNVFPISLIVELLKV